MAPCGDVAGAAILGDSNSCMAGNTDSVLFYRYNIAGGSCGKIFVKIDTSGDGEGLGDIVSRGV